jgi:Uma2 family endonuclease
MSETVPRAIVAVEYAEAAQAYLRSLPAEHFMESTAQASQRKITLESLDLVHARRPAVQVFNELLVQYRRPGQRKPGQVVPDNLVVLCDTPIEANGSYDVPLQPVGPFWVLEYVSKSNKRKDYEDNFDKYEQELKVPYFLLFYPDNQELTLYHHTGTRYQTVLPNQEQRYPIPELEVEVALHEGWMRFWFRGELLPLPADLLGELDHIRLHLQAERQRAEHLQQQVTEERQRSEHLQQQVTEERGRAEQFQRTAEEKSQALEAMERELQRLRAQFEKRSPEPPDPS